MQALKNLGKIVVRFILVKYETLMERIGKINGQTSRKEQLAFLMLVIRLLERNNFAVVDKTEILNAAAYYVHKTIQDSYKDISMFGFGGAERTILGGALSVNFPKENQPYGIDELILYSILNKFIQQFIHDFKREHATRVERIGKLSAPYMLFLKKQYEQQAALLVLYVVLLNDGYYSFKQDESNKQFLKSQKFFKIFQQVPLDLLLEIMNVLTTGKQNFVLPSAVEERLSFLRKIENDAASEKSLDFYNRGIWCSPAII